MSKVLHILMAAFLIGGGLTVFADKLHNRPTQRTTKRPVDRGPGVLTQQQEDKDVEALIELENSLSALHKFNTEGKSSLNSLPITGERMPQSLPQSMDEATK